MPARSTTWHGRSSGISLVLFGASGAYLFGRFLMLLGRTPPSAAEPETATTD